jgi:lactobin A/cerein 7B family class IIb bacteriocin
MQFKEYQMASLDTLSAFGTELVDEQLDSVDGGIIPVVVAVGGFLLGYAVGKNIP